MVSMASMALSLHAVSFVAYLWTTEVPARLKTTYSHPQFTSVYLRRHQIDGTLRSESLIKQMEYYVFGPTRAFLIFIFFKPLL
ncbi:hypothetical protein BC830DRAFT_298561 [Chytriomyces sp. MP71]|nr:hypothetical protein BC830DRAFT_298561 [Chytriomyces sp. MP71]